MDNLWAGEVGLMTEEAYGDFLVHSDEGAIRAECRAEAFMSHGNSGYTKESFSASDCGVDTPSILSPRRNGC